MGVGKTTIGKQLAGKLGRTFFDSDHVIEERTGADIPLIFELEGEAGFRRREKAVLEDLLQGDDIILATGGGAVLDPANRKLFGEHGFVIYLSAPLEQLLRHTAKDRNRPLLQNTDPRKKMRELIRQRDPLYREVANEVIDASDRGVRSIVNSLLKLVREHQL